MLSRSQTLVPRWQQNLTLKGNKTRNDPSRGKIMSKDIAEKMQHGYNEFSSVKVSIKIFFFKEWHLWSICYVSCILYTFPKWSQKCSSELLNRYYSSHSRGKLRLNSKLIYSRSISCQADSVAQAQGGLVLKPKYLLPIRAAWLTLSLNGAITHGGSPTHSWCGKLFISRW